MKDMFKPGLNIAHFRARRAANVGTGGGGHNAATRRLWGSGAVQSTADAVENQQCDFGTA